MKRHHEGKRFAMNVETGVSMSPPQCQFESCGIFVTSVLIKLWRHYEPNTKRKPCSQSFCQSVSSWQHIFFFILSRHEWKISFSSRVGGTWFPILSIFLFSNFFATKFIDDDIAHTSSLKMEKIIHVTFYANLSRHEVFSLLRIRFKFKAKRKIMQLLALWSTLYSKRQA